MPKVSPTYSKKETWVLDTVGTNLLEAVLQREPTLDERRQRFRKQAKLSHTTPRAEAAVAV